MNQPDPIYDQLDQTLQSFINSISIIQSIRPTNIEQEKQKFFDSQWTYNPQFTYHPPTKLPQKFRIKFQSLFPQIPDTPIGQLYQAKFQECLTILDLIDCIGRNDQQFQNLSQKIFGAPTSESVEKAHTILSQISPHPPGIKLNAEQIAQRMEDEIAKLQLTGHITANVSSDHPNSKIVFRRISGHIIISSNCNRSLASTESVIAHELKTHAVRTYYGKQFPYKIFWVGTANYFQDEEGLATLMGASTSESYLRRSALMLLSIHYNLNYSFAETFKRLLPHLPSQERAWNFALNSKRGIVDTQQPGAFTKDLYLQWAIQVKAKLLSKPELLNTAFLGKADLNTLAQFAHLITPINHPTPQLKLDYVTI